MCNEIRLKSIPKEGFGCDDLPPFVQAALLDLSFTVAELPAEETITVLGVKEICEISVKDRKDHNENYYVSFWSIFESLKKHKPRATEWLMDNTLFVRCTPNTFVSFPKDQCYSIEN